MQAKAAHRSLGEGGPPRLRMSYGWQAEYDRVMTLRRVLLCAVLLAAFTGVAHAKDYSAERFDARIELLRGGALRVTERVLVRFESGTFTQFDREIPGRLTDGIEVVSASMDGAVLPAGEGPGQVQIRKSSRTRITWRFPKVSGSSHLFELTYIVRGVVRQADDADVVAWRALPGQHAYRIASSTIDIALPERANRHAVAGGAPGRRVVGRR